MYQNSGTGKTNRTYQIRTGRRRRRQRQKQRLVILCCLTVFLLGFLSGKAVMLEIMEQEGKKAEVRAAAGLNSEETDVAGDEGIGERNVKSGDWNLVLVNRNHPLSSDFTVSLEPVGDGHQVDRRIASDLLKMLEDGKEAGCDIRIVSSFRTMKKQTQLYERKVEQMRSQGYS